MKKIALPLVFLTLYQIFLSPSLGANNVRVDGMEKKSTPARAAFFSPEAFLISPDTVFVDGSFNSGTPGWGVTHFAFIQLGINAVVTGGVVMVYNGLYYEHLVINKKLSLVGESRDSTIVDGDDTLNVIIVNADLVEISGFTIQNSKYNLNYSGIRLNSDSNIISDDNFFYNGSAVDINESEHNQITRNNISNNIVGIHLDHANYNIVSENTISYNSAGVFCYWEIYHNTFQNNIITNGYSGFDIDFAEYNTIQGNVISFQSVGFNFHACNYNTIVDNQYSGKKSSC